MFRWPAHRYRGDDVANRIRYVPFPPGNPGDSDIERGHRLRETLEFVLETIPYYKLRYHGRIKPSLEAFPIIDRKEIAENFDEFYAAPHMPDFVLMSGGTTGDPCITLRELPEYEQLLRHQTGLRLNTYVDPRTIDRGLVLHCPSYAHGTLYRPPNGLPIIDLQVTLPGHVRFVRKLLDNGLVVGGRRLPVSFIHGAQGVIRLITAKLAATNFDPTRSRISEVGVYGKYLSPFWRNRLQAYWQAPVVNHFGMTELNTSVVRECGQCGGFHHNDSLVVELLDPVSRCSASSGACMLVPTTLLPFTKVMPRIRYWTQDLVESLPRCELTGTCGFRLIGRYPYTLLARDGERCVEYLSHHSIVEALEQIDDVVHIDRTRASFLENDPIDSNFAWETGSPSFDIDVVGSGTAEPRMIIWVELVFDPANHPSRAESVFARIAEAIAAAVPRLPPIERSSSMGAVSVTLLPPGGLRCLSRQPKLQ